MLTHAHTHTQAHRVSLKDLMTQNQKLRDPEKMLRSQYNKVTPCSHTHTHACTHTVTYAHTLTGTQSVPERLDGSEPESERSRKGVEVTV